MHTTHFGRQNPSSAAFSEARPSRKAGSGAGLRIAEAATSAPPGFLQTGPELGDQTAWTPATPVFTSCRPATSRRSTAAPAPRAPRTPAAGAQPSPPRLCAEPSTLAVPSPRGPALRGRHHPSPGRPTHLSRGKPPHLLSHLQKRFVIVFPFGTPYYCFFFQFFNFLCHLSINTVANVNSKFHLSTLSHHRTAVLPPPRPPHCTGLAQGPRRPCVGGHPAPGSAHRGRGGKRRRGCRSAGHGSCSPLRRPRPAEEAARRRTLATRTWAGARLSFCLGLTRRDPSPGWTQTCPSWGLLVTNLSGSWKDRGVQAPCKDSERMTCHNIQDHIRFKTTGSVTSGTL